MQLGFALPLSGSWATPANVTTIATRAEELGYASAWTFQRLLSPVDRSMGIMYERVSDPLTTLAFAAAVTSRIRLGVAVVNIPFVSPLWLAKQAATVDVLSNGRLDLGLGLGWSDDEFVASGTTKAGQGRRAVEFVEVLRTIWTQPEVEHAGEFYTIPRSRAEPKPVQPSVPILLGGSAEAALRRAGRIADGWVSSSRADLGQLGESVAIIKRAASEAGRDPEALRFICRGVVKVRGSGERALLTGTLDEIRADLDQVARQGITELFVDLNFDPEAGSPEADPDATMERANQILTALAPA